MARRRRSANLPRSPIVAITPELDVLAEDVGRAWAAALADGVRAQSRDVAGGWPGTMTEARGQILAALGPRYISRAELNALSSTAYRAAQAQWRIVALPDPDT
jgi:hypothetical protein